MFIIISGPAPGSGVARVAKLGGQEGGKGLYQGGKHIREPEEPTLHRHEVSAPLKSPSSWHILDSLFGGFWVFQLIVFIYLKKYS